MAMHLAAVSRPLVALRQLWQRLQGAPAILHITHWKAGSQWIHKILHACCPERVVPPAGAYNHLLHSPVRPGRVYPTVYATREQLQQIALPRGTKKFIVIRDPRDTLVSSYFSKKISHHSGTTKLDHRRHLQACTPEEGLRFLIEHDFEKVAVILRSWRGADDPVIRYEDLLRDDEAILERVLLQHCRLPVPKALLLEAIRASRFENLTRGRQRGQEDVGAHERKGIAGDWRNHFTKPVTDAFKERYGDLLINAGYERDLSW